MTATGGRQGRPVIGLTTYREQAAWSVWNMSADLLPAVYTRSVEAAGGVVVLLPPQNDGMAEVVSRLDGLIITGGADVDPERYGQMPHPMTKVRRDRDAWEFGLLDAADRIGLPTLGICRGMQVMAVRAGGSLEQHLPDVVGHEEHAPGGNAFGWTSIATREGSRVRTFRWRPGPGQLSPPAIGCQPPGLRSHSTRRRWHDRSNRGSRTAILAGRAVASRKR